MISHRVSLAWFAAAAFAVLAVICVPIGMEANRLLATEDDPAAIADLSLIHI